MNKPLKIMHVVHGLPRGGLENGVVNLLNHLPEDRFQQAVCCLDSRGEMADRIARPIQISVLNRKPYDLLLPFRLARIYRSSKPDIIHCRNWNTWFDAVVAKMLSGHKSVLVWSFHGFADGNDFPPRRRKISKVLSYATNQLFAVCRDSANRFSSFTKIPSHRFDVIYNGVDCERYRPAENKTAIKKNLGLPVDKVVISTVASLTPVKDHMYLLQSIHEIVKNKKLPMKFLFIGDGPLKQELRTKIEELELQDYVVLLGNKDNIAEYLSASDLFVLPSRLEGMSNAILEAMASGLPVVARNVGGNVELVENNTTGLLCKPDDTKDMAQALQRLVEDDQSREQMGKNARKHAENKFSIDAMIDSYDKYYTRVAKSNR